MLAPPPPLTMPQTKGLAEDNLPHMSQQRMCRGWTNTLPNIPCPPLLQPRLEDMQGMLQHCLQVQELKEGTSLQNIPRLLGCSPQ